jgi:hypothetical protein
VVTVPIIRTWANRGRGYRHPGCDGTCTDEANLAINELLHEARTRMAARGGSPAPVLKPPRCPNPVSERELDRLIAEAKAKQEQEGAVLRAEVEANRRRPWQVAV